MAKGKIRNRRARPSPKPSAGRGRAWPWVMSAAVAVSLVGLGGFQFAKNRAGPSTARSTSKNRPLSDYARPLPPSDPMGEGKRARGGTDEGSEPTSSGLTAREQAAAGAANLGSNSQNSGAAPPAVLEVAQAVMVTVELDFGATVPGVATALLDIERRYQPDDGKGRTFAILDAYGEPTPGGKLHLSMHVSTEKPGTCSLIFKRTGEMLWSSRIVPSKDPNKRQFTGKNLSIFIDDGAGHLLTVDGSNNPTWIMDAVVKEKGALLNTVWPSGAEHEVTFIYSACGCPVKVMARREGERIVRTKELPVMFPDDPAVVELIARLMRW